MSPVTKFVVGSTFGIYPPRGGGQLRIFHLYRQLARHYKVDVVALVDGHEHSSRRELAPGLTEIRVPKSQAHVSAEAELHRATGVSVTDVAFAKLHPLTPDFSEAVAASLVAGCVLIGSHPYAFPAMRQVDGGAEWWYDAHNVEADLKAMILPPGRTGKQLLAATRAVERDLCKRARVVLTSSAEDRERLRELYGLPPERLMVVANGVDSGSIAFALPSERRALRARLRMKRPLALFIGSWHEPNVLAAREILKLASDFPAVQFAIAGSVGIPLDRDERPANVELFGSVSDELKGALLRVATVALNPMLHGSGTNIKMLDYLAAGVPVISTEVGARGLGLECGRDLRVASLTSFSEALQTAIDEPDEAADSRALATRREIEMRFDWRTVCAPLLDAISRRDEHPSHSIGSRSAMSA